MMYRVETADGTQLIVDQPDLEFVTAFLVLRGYPPVKVEMLSEPVPESEAVIRK